MKQTALIMGMPITVDIVGGNDGRAGDLVFAYFRAVDARFSTYRADSEITAVNHGLPQSQWSDEMAEVMRLSEQTRKETHGYFNIHHNGTIDPSGLVKGWAIERASHILEEQGLANFYVEAGGDIQAHGHNGSHQPWVIGIRNPFNKGEVIKRLTISEEGVATSGTYVRGQHIYNPHQPEVAIDRVKSLTVVGPNIYDADRLATAAFAMGPTGLSFIASIAGLEGYMVTADGMAHYTDGFSRYVLEG